MVIGVCLPARRARLTKTLVSIAVTSAGSAVQVAAGATLALTATATYSDSTTADVTSSCTWSSGDATGATVGASTGVVIGVAVSAGVVITATLGAISGTKTLAVYADFTSQSAGALASMIAGFGFSRASARTVQTGTNTFTTTGLTTDVAGIGRVLSSDPLALSFSATRTNVCRDNRDPTQSTWDAGSGYSTTRPTGTAPDGAATTSTRFNGGAAYSKYVTITGHTGEKYVLSMWTKSNTGSSQSAQWEVSVGNVAYTATTSWVRQVSAVASFAATGYLVPCNGLAQDLLCDAVQAEKGEYEDDVIVTAGASATRAGERLYYTSLSKILASGRLTLALRFRAKGTAAQHATDNANICLWYVDANNNAYIAAATRVLTVTIGGASNTCTLSAWSKGDTVRIQIAAGGSSATVVKTQYNAGAVSTPSITGSALGSLSGSSIDLLCEGTTKQLGAWVEEIAFTSQAWAA